MRRPICTTRPRQTGWRSGRSRLTGCPGRRRSTEVLDWSDAPFAKWFVGGKLNVAYNCVDRHVEAGNGDRVAIHWEGEPAATAATITYAELQGRGVQGRQRASPSSGWSPATGSPSTCRWCPRRSSRCWHAHGSASCTRWCSRVSPRPRCAPGSTTPKPSWSSPPTDSTGAARRRRSRRRSTRPSTGQTVRRARSGGAPHRHRHAVDRGPRPVVARDRRQRPRPSTRRRRSTPSTRCSCSTPRAPPVSPRASCTPPAAT